MGIYDKKIKDNIVIQDGQQVVSANAFDLYKLETERHVPYDPISVLGLLSGNADLFFGTKDKYKTIINYLFSKDEINKMIEENGFSGIDALAKAIGEIRGGKKSNKLLDAVRKVAQFEASMAKVLSHEQDEIDQSLLSPSHKNNLMTVYENGAVGFIKNLSLLHNSDELNARPYTLNNLAKMNQF